MMTPAEMLDTVKEYQTTDSISRKNALFDLIRQRAWEVWFMCYQCARKLYLDYPLPEVGKILNGWGPIEKDLEKYVDGHSYYTQIDIHSPIYHRPIWDDKIILSGLTEKGINIGLPTSIAVSYRMFNPDYLDYRIREIKPYLHGKLNDEIYRKEQELKQLQSAYKETETFLNFDYIRPHLARQIGEHLLKENMIQFSIDDKNRDMNIIRAEVLAARPLEDDFQ